jgi:hypothetical protein
LVIFVRVWLALISRFSAARHASKYVRDVVLAVVLFVLLNLIMGLVFFVAYALLSKGPDYVWRWLGR